MSRDWEEAVAELMAAAIPTPMVGSGIERAVRAVLHYKLSASATERTIVAWNEAGALSPHSFNLDDLVAALQEARVTVSRSTVAFVAKVGRHLIGMLGTATDDWADLAVSAESLRDDLLRIKGAGRTTVDRLLLYVFDRPVYPVDRGTYRILVRHGHIDSSADYDEARSTIEAGFPRAAEDLRILSTAFERIGEEFCRAGAPRCERCPLKTSLPEGGPIEG